MRAWASVVTFALAASAACGPSEPPGDTAGTSTTAGARRYQVTATVLESKEHGPQLCVGAVADSYPPQCGGPDVVGWDWNAVKGEESAAGTTWVSAHVVGTYDDDANRFTLTQPPGPARPAPSTTADSDFSPGCSSPDPGPDPSDREFDNYQEALADVHVGSWVSEPGATAYNGPYVLTVLVRPGAAARAKAEIRKGYGAGLCVVERNGPTEAELRRVMEEITRETTADRSKFGTPLGYGADGRSGYVRMQVVLADEGTWPRSAAAGATRCAWRTRSSPPTDPSRSVVPQA